MPATHVISGTRGLAVPTSYPPEIEAAYKTGRMLDRTIKLDIGQAGRAAEELSRGWLGVVLDCPQKTTTSPRKLSYEAETVAEIFSSGALQDLDGSQVLPALRDWHRVLREGGRLTIQVPDLEWCCRHRAVAQIAEREPAAFFPHPLHTAHPYRTGSTEHTLQHYALQAGFDVSQSSRRKIHGRVVVRLDCRKPERKKMAGVSLVAADSRHVDHTARVMRHCLSLCRFRNALLFTDKCVMLPPEIVRIQIPPIGSREAYSEFMIRNLPLYADLLGEHILVVQHDGFVLNAEAWRDEFLAYDYVGAPWSDGVVGNGGFSLRSKAFLRTLLAIQEEMPTTHPEDEVLGRDHRERLERTGVRFAPTAVAARFSVEDQKYRRSFGYHGARTEALSGISARMLSRDLSDCYNAALLGSSNICEHLETLRRLGGECRHITEWVGRAGASAAAFLIAHPETVATYDFAGGSDLAPLQIAASDTNVVHGVLRADVLGPDFAETDLLFVDNLHCDERMWQKLARQAPKVRRYLVFHDARSLEDCETGGNVEVAGQTSFRAALQRFLTDHTDWRLVEEQSGRLFVLNRERAPAEAPDAEPPTMCLPTRTAIQFVGNQMSRSAPRIRYIISSHVKHEEVVLPVLLPSMHGIDRDNIIVTVGGAMRPRKEVRCGITILYVRHSSLEWTGMIEVVERGLEADWWFWLQDTCECGPQFRNLAEGNFDPTAEMTAVSSVPGSAQGNLGMYSQRLLTRHKDYLISLKDLAEQEKVRQEEGFCRWGCGTAAVYPNAACYDLGQLDAYGDGVLRSMEHYKAVDLYSYKVAAR